MTRVKVLCLAGGAIIAAACSETSSPSNLFDLTNSSTFSSVPTGLTTPLVLKKHALLAQLRDAGARAVAMEVSSHARV